MGAGFKRETGCSAGDVENADGGVFAFPSRWAMGSEIPRKVIISGTGRSGTTLIMQLLTQLGLDTGFRDIHDGVFESSHAGMEVLPSDPGSPYIVKSPYLCALLFDDLKAGRIIVDHAFIPIRRLRAVAASRVAVERARAKDTKAADGGDWLGTIPGGLWGTKDPKQQGAILAKQFHNLMYTLTVFDVPHTLIEFPRLALEPEYLYAKLRFLVESIEYPAFLDAFKLVVRPSLIHDFQNKKAPDTTGM